MIAIVALALTVIMLFISMFINFIIFKFAFEQNKEIERLKNINKD